MKYKFYKNGKGCTAVLKQSGRPLFGKITFLAITGSMQINNSPCIPCHVMKDDMKNLEPVDRKYVEEHHPALIESL